MMKGKLALCGRGNLGIITNDEKRSVTYADQHVEMAYVGLHLTDGPGHKIGDPWSSRSPMVVGSIKPSHDGSFVIDDIDGHFLVIR